MVELQKEIGAPINYADKKDEYTKPSEKLMDTWNKDADWKLKARKGLCWFFCIFLVIENVLLWIFVFLIFQYRSDLFSEIQPVLSVIISGTIIQTGYIIKIIVKWLFTDISYSNHPVFSLKDEGKQNEQKNILNLLNKR